MKAEHRQFLELNRSHHHTLVVAGFLTNLTNEVRQTMLDIIRQEFSPCYLCCLHCNGDVAQMIKYVYVQYDELLKREAVDKINIPVTISKPSKQKNARTKNT